MLTFWRAFDLIFQNQEMVAMEESQRSEYMGFLVFIQWIVSAWWGSMWHVSVVDCEPWTQVNEWKWKCFHSFPGNGMLNGELWGGMVDPWCVFVMAWIIIPNILASFSFCTACICIASCQFLERLSDSTFAKHSTVASSFVFFLFHDPTKITSCCFVSSK